MNRKKWVLTGDSFRMNFQFGFTLIELLVVVLIIGILSSVALPQYQVAVEKGRASNAIVAARAIKDAEELYYMANGEYTNDMNLLDLDVSVPKDFTLFLMKEGNNKVELWREHPQLLYVILFSFDHRPGLENVHYCAAALSTPLAKRICSTYGPEFLTDVTYARYRIN